MHILIVGDDQSERRFAAWRCSQLGHTTIEAGSLKRAQELLAEGEIDCSIVDIKLQPNRSQKDMWVWELAHDLKEKGIPFIWCSRGPYNDNWKHYGAIGFLWKPLNKGLLADALNLVKEEICAS